MLLILFLFSLCLADQRHFVWTYEYKTVKRGEVEFEHYYTNSYPNASNLSEDLITMSAIKIGINGILQIEN